MKAFEEPCFSGNMSYLMFFHTCIIRMSNAHKLFFTSSQNSTYFLISSHFLFRYFLKKYLYMKLYSPTYSYNSFMCPPSLSRILSTHAFLLMIVNLCIDLDSLIYLHTFKFLNYIYIYTYMDFWGYFSCYVLCKSNNLYTFTMIRFFK